MVTPRSEAYTFDLSGGRLCLDLANTVSDRSSDRPVDHLRTYGDLIAWARQAGTVAPGVARALLAEAAARPEAARHALATALDAREMLYRLFAAIAAGKRPRPEDLAVLNDHVPAAFARAQPNPSHRNADCRKSAVRATVGPLHARAVGQPC